MALTQSQLKLGAEPILAKAKLDCHVVDVTSWLTSSSGSKTSWSQLSWS